MSDWYYRRGGRSGYNLWYGQRGDEENHVQLAMFIDPNELNYVVGKLNRFEQMQSQLLDARLEIRRLHALMVGDVPESLCNASYTGPDFTGEALRCNVPHEPDEDHGHLARRLITWR